MTQPSILVVEDESIVALDISRTLEAHGYRVAATVATGAEALARAAQGGIDLVLMDIILRGDMDGVAAADRIGSLHGIPVLYLTAYADPDTLARAKVTRPFGYILKPFSERELVTTVEMALYRHAADLSLRGREQQLAAILGAITEAVVAVDAAGVIEFVNPVAERLAGRPGDALLGRPLAQAFPFSLGGTGAPAPCPAAAALGRGAPAAIPEGTTLRLPDGRAVSIEGSAAPALTGPRGSPGAVLVFRDITARLRAEAESLRIDRLESLGILAGGIAHDFNNILTGIMGSISHARVVAAEGRPVEPMLADAETACVRATGLTQQLLTFSRGGVPVKRPSSVENLVRETCAFTLSGSASSCRLRFDPGLWTIDADPVQIGQVIANLVINADQAMPGGGALTVEARNVAVPGSEPVPLPPGRYVRISVMDTGTGIPAEYLERIFDPYFTTKKKGSGLGLTTCYSIVKKHAGHIDVHSKINQGSEFRVYLPASDGRAPEPGPAPDAPLPKGEGRVLIMDDEQTVRLVAGKLIQHLGYTVEAVGTGEEAVELYNRRRADGQPFDVVIMDLTIPGGMGGKEALVEMKRTDPAVRAVVSSGYSNDPIMADFRAHGFFNVLSKPYNIKDLARVLSECTRKA